jgi:hypothetical protein
LYTLASCPDSSGLPIPLGVVTATPLTANTCYDATEYPALTGGKFLSFQGYPIVENPAFICSLEVFFKPDCKGPHVANQAADNGYNKCYNALTSPENLAVADIGGESFRWFCYEA